jgi:predicted RNA binding protein YcfA (HicA-like mRNA interferase family)
LVEGHYSAVAKELRRLGFVHRTNAKGSHEKWSDASGRTVIVPRHLKSRHTANGILRDAGSDLRL